MDNTSRGRLAVNEKQIREGLEIEKRADEISGTFPGILKEKRKYFLAKTYPTCG
jgi:hypothetical protein